MFEEERDAEAGEFVRGDVFAKDVAGPAGAFGGCGDEDARGSGGAGGEAEAVRGKLGDAGGEFLFGVGAGFVGREG